MKMREIKIMEFLEKRKSGEITQKQASIVLRLSIRHIRRLENKYSKKGAAGLVHGNRGKKSRRQVNPQKKQEILSLMQTKYKGFGPTLAAELLLEEDGLQISVQALWRFLIEAGLRTKKKSKKAQYRCWRAPKEYYGEMEQVDCSEHDWFQGRAPRCALVHFIDDATSAISWAEFIESESLFGVMQATKHHFAENGRPLSIYTDKGKVFKVNNNNKEGQFITQYQRMLREVDVKLIHAHSPQAKGRVERTFNTAQDRLVKMLTLRKISTIEDANKFLQEEYVPKYNAKFACRAAKEGDVHRSMDGINLENLFVTKVKRVVTNDWTIQYRNQTYQIHETKCKVRPKDQITVCKKLDGSIFLLLNNSILSFGPIEKRIRIKPAKVIKVERISYAQKDHPWRRTNSLFYKKEPLERKSR